MPRVARVVIPGCPHHVTQRGNNHQDVFFVDDDRQVYLEILAKQAGRFGLSIQGYCLMTNHIHLVATPRTAESLAKAVGQTHWLYTRYVNALHGRSGHLWQNRFYSCVLGDEHYWATMAYVERNPVRAKIVRCAWRYPWSSAVAHCEWRDKTGLLDLKAWLKMLPPDGDWREALVKPDDKEIIHKLRTVTQRGHPLGSDKFISKIEHALNRRLHSLTAGRPKKTK